MRRRFLKADLAKALHLSKARVTQLAALGMPIHSLEAAQSWREAHLDQVHVRRTADRVSSNGRGTSDHQRLLRAQAELAELKAAQMRGGLILRRDAIGEAVKAVGVMRTRLLLIPKSLAAQVPEDCRGIVEDAAERLVHEALAELARYGA